MRVSAPFRMKGIVMEDFSSFICYVIKTTAKKMDKFLGKELELFGINFPQALILFSLLEQEGSTLTEIGSRAQIENSSLTTMVDKLEKEELVERRLDPQDRRIVRLFLTDKGRALGEKVLSAAAGFNEQLKTRLRGDEKTLLESLSSISAILE